MVEEDRLTDRYVLEDRIAAGGMGGVYVARDDRLDRKVAVKILKDDLAQDPRFVERFRREARSAAALSHPNVAAVFDYGEENGRHFIVMELVEGRDLSRLLREEGPLEPERAARIAAGVSRALEHAHAAGVVHRDIKPANIMLSPGDRVKVTDFGIARAIGESTLTATGSVMGTAQYISPEQAAGESITPSSDIYAVGIVLFEMLTGSVPFTGDNALAVAMKHVNEDVPPPSERNPDAPSGLDSVVLHATNREPVARYSDAGAMAAALEGVAIALESGGDTAVLGPEETEQTVWPIPGARYDPERLGKRVLTVLGVLVAIALLLLAWRFLGADPAREVDRGGSPADATAGGAAPADPDPEAAGLTLEDYTDRNYKEVESLLKAAGVAVVKEDVDAESPKDTILSQDPGPGTTVEEGDTVTLTVSTGNAPESSDDDDDDDDDDDEGEGGPGSGEGKGKSKGKAKEKD